MKLFILSTFILLFASCKQANLSSGQEQQLSSGFFGYINPNSKIRVFQQNNDGSESPITQLESFGGEIVVPSALYKGEFGDRTQDKVSVPSDLLVKVNTSQVESGDTYFETLILGKTTQISNVTTALSWYLRFGFNSKVFNISSLQFSNLVKSIEVSCLACRQKTNSEVLRMILLSENLKSKILTELKKSNSNLQSIAWQYPDYVLAWADPVVDKTGSITLSKKENEFLNIEFKYLKIEKSNEILYNSFWEHSFNSASYRTSSEHSYNYKLSYEDKGTHQVIATIPLVSGDKKFFFNYEVSDENRSPIWNSNVELNFIVNRKYTVDLKSYCHDLDPEDTSLSYNLISGPLGLVVSPNGVLTWLPKDSSNPASSQVGDHKVIIQATDVKSGASSVQIIIHVLSDQLPTFVTTTPNWSLNEGLSAQLTIQTHDAEKDPLQLNVLSVSGLKSGYPNGAGVIAVSKTGSLGDESFTLTFTPSFLQVIGLANDNIKVTLQLTYDSASGDYDSSGKPVTQELTLNITNQDDPPIWNTEPVGTTVTENVAFQYLAGGVVADPSPNSTAITYSIEDTHSNRYCDWSMTVDSITGEISATPTYLSADTCQFRIVATDAQNLSTYSNFITFQVNNVNRAVALKSSPTTSLTAEEKKNLVIDFKEIFEDLDNSEGDPLEVMTYTCLNCVGLGVNLTISDTADLANWTPSNSASNNSPYMLQFRATDRAGTFADYTLQVDVIDSPAPVLITGTTTLTVNENATALLTLDIAPASIDAVDNYNYTILNPTCTIIGSASPCDIDLVQNPIAMSGVGEQSFSFIISTDYDDGNAAYPVSLKNYNISFQVEKSDDPTVYASFSTGLTIQNLNRAPTAIGIGALNSTGAPYTYGSSVVTITVDASKDTKSGSSWKKTYTLPFDLQDADAVPMNDSYSYLWLTSGAPGTIENSLWSFKLPSCVSPGTTTVSRTFKLQGTDGRGQFIVRDVELRISKAAASGSCL